MLYIIHLKNKDLYVPGWDFVFYLSLWKLDSLLEMMMMSQLLGENLREEEKSGRCLSWTVNLDFSSHINMLFAL